MAGLVQTTTTAGGSESAASDASATGTEPVGVSVDMADVSHLDSLFQTSGWTREDIELLAAMLNLVLVALLVYREVA